MFSAQFLVLSRFSYRFGQIPSYFWTWTDKIHISRFSRFPGCAGNPACLNIIWASMLTKSTLKSICKVNNWFFFLICLGSQNEYAKNFTLVRYIFWMDFRWTSMILLFYLEYIHVNNSPIYTYLVALDSRVTGNDDMNPPTQTKVKRGEMWNSSQHPGQTCIHVPPSRWLCSVCDPGQNPG